MADHIKYAVSVDVVDEYLQPLIDYSGDEGNNAGTVAQQTLYRHYTIVGGTIGGSVTATTDATGGIEFGGATVTGYSAGVPTDTILALNQTKQIVGAENTKYEGIFVKHTGFTTAARTVASLDYVLLFKESPADAYPLICALPPGGAIFLPHPPNPGVAMGFWVAASSTVAGVNAAATVCVNIVTMT